MIPDPLPDDSGKKKEEPLIAEGQSSIEGILGRKGSLLKLRYHREVGHQIGAEVRSIRGTRGSYLSDPEERNRHQTHRKRDTGRQPQARRRGDVSKGHLVASKRDRHYHQHPQDRRAKPSGSPDPRAVENASDQAAQKVPEGDPGGASFIAGEPPAGQQEAGSDEDGEGQSKNERAAQTT